MRTQQEKEDIVSYYIEVNGTCRSVAKDLGCGKQTVNKYIHEMKFTNNNLYNKAMEILNRNKKEGHIRGGQTTKKRFRDKTSNGCKSLTNN